MSPWPGFVKLSCHHSEGSSSVRVTMERGREAVVSPGRGVIGKLLCHHGEGP